MALTPKPIDDSKWRPRDHHQIVTHIQIAAIPNPERFRLPGGHGGQLLHWYVALVFMGNATGTSQRSLVFDTVKVDGDPIVQITITSHPYMASHRAAGGATVPVEPNSAYKTTDEIFGLLRRYKFDHYSYDGDGSGCRYWSRAVIAMLMHAGVVNRSWNDLIDESVNKLKNNVLYWVPPETEADFFWPDTPQDMHFQ